MGLQVIDQIVAGVYAPVAHCKTKFSRSELVGKIRRHYLYKRGQVTKDSVSDGDTSGKSSLNDLQQQCLATTSNFAGLSEIASLELGWVGVL